MLASSRSRRRGLLSLCAAVMLVCGLSTVAHGQAPAAISADELRALIARHQGKVVVVNFWASWCPPCRKEFPDLVRLYVERRAQGVEVIAVSMNEADEAESIEQFLRRFNPPFAVYRAATVSRSFHEKMAADWAGELPVTLIFDAAGRQVHSYKKPVTYAELARDVAALLPAPGRR